MQTVFTLSSYMQNVYSSGLAFYDLSCRLWFFALYDFFCWFGSLPNAYYWK